MTHFSTIFGRGNYHLYLNQSPYITPVPKQSSPDCTHQQPSDSHNYRGLFSIGMNSKSECMLYLLLEEGREGKRNRTGLEGTRFLGAKRTSRKCSLMFKGKGVWVVFPSENASSLWL